jgi:hypothetical protein
MKTPQRGRDRVGWTITPTAAVHNLVRMRNMMLEGSPLPETLSGKTIILPAPDRRRREQLRFIREFAHHKGANIDIKSEKQFNSNFFKIFFK